MDRFSEILFDLGKEINVDLYPDPNRICQLNYDEEFTLQLQFDEPRSELIIASLVTEVPAGKYREKLFRATLIYNEAYPRLGTFGYSESNNMLIFFDKKKAADITGEQMFHYLEIFIAEVKLWKDAIEGGKPLPIAEPSGPTDSIFGVKK